MTEIALIAGGVLDGSFNPMNRVGYLFSIAILMRIDLEKRMETIRKSLTLEILAHELRWPLRRDDCHKTLHNQQHLVQL